MLEFEQVTYSYAGPEAPALTDLSLQLRPGEVLAVLGANGSGKSTLVRLTDGILLPDSGSVRVDGIDTRDADRHWDVRSKVGLVLQDPDNQIVGTVVEEDVAFAPENLGLPREELRRRVDDALAAVGLAEFAAREPHLLSGGQKQRLAIAGALAMDPAYLVLDEPTSMLDPRGRADVLAIIGRLRDAGRGIVHVTHHLADALTADRVLVLDRGAVAFLGTPDGLLAGECGLEALGLRLPPIWFMAEELRRHGLRLPLRALDPDAIGASLWR